MGGGALAALFPFHSVEVSLDRHSGIGRLPAGVVAVRVVGLPQAVLVLPVLVGPVRERNKAGTGAASVGPGDALGTEPGFELGELGLVSVMGTEVGFTHFTL